MFLKAICSGKIQESKWPTETYPIFQHTNPEVSACYQSFPIQQYAIISACSYEELVKIVNNVLEGHMLRKKPRKQMTKQRHTPFFPNTNPKVSACYQSFPVKHGAIISAPSYKKVVKTLNNVLQGHMLRKNPRKQMTNRDVPHFFHTNT
jgi:hypothetical protein